MEKLHEARGRETFGLLSQRRIVRFGADQQWHARAAAPSTIKLRCSRSSTRPTNRCGGLRKARACS